MHHGGDSKALRQSLCKRAGPNIERKVATPCKRIEAHVAQGFWETATGVVTDKQDRVFSQWIEHSERPGFFGR